ncbi:hypothetical protein [Lewinella sp. IMCC34183]|uniref:hypothetical protein n=1 Tax=Lewinella sp. IMCC34183 TaxID=2248762 RepID=UPI000E275F5B|nr:hypothetical protein [Lewinella sp. IMCC34183]
MYRLLLLTCLLAGLACGEVSETVRDAAAVTNTSSGTTGELQGRWRSEDDSLATLRFEGNLMIMGYDGMDEKSSDNYVVGQTCPDVSDAVAPTGKGRYLTVPDLGNCYFITKLTEKRLEMSLVGRGNTLRYVREKAGDGTPLDGDR